MKAGSSPATARQLARIDVLLAERDTTGMVVPRHLAHLDRPTASQLITELEQQPRRPRAPARPVRVPVNANGAGPGVYDLGGDVFRLRANEAGTGVYPERLIIERGAARWVYAPEVARRIYPAERISVRELAVRIAARNTSQP